MTTRDPEAQMLTPITFAEFYPRGFPLSVLWHDSDGLLMFPLEAWPGRRTSAIEALKARIAALPFEPSAGGPWVAGGAVAHAMRGDVEAVQGCDLDVFFATVEQMEASRAALVAAGWTRRDPAEAPPPSQESDDDGLTWGSGVWQTHTDGAPERNVDLVFASAQSLGAHLASFDVTAASLATDGEHLYARPDAVLDAYNRTLRVRRVTRPKRILKYLEYGYLPATVDPDAFTETAKVDGWCDPALTRLQALGRVGRE